jgi:hypothetical protein
VHSTRVGCAAMLSCELSFRKEHICLPELRVMAAVPADEFAGPPILCPCRHAPAATAGWSALLAQAHPWFVFENLLCCLPSSCSESPQVLHKLSTNPCLLFSCRWPAACTGCVLHEMLVVGLPQATDFPAAEKRLPGLAGCPPQGLQELFQSCVSQADMRCTAQAAVAKLQSMQAGVL